MEDHMLDNPTNVRHVGLHGNGMFGIRLKLEFSEHILKYFSNHFCAYYSFSPH